MNKEHEKRILAAMPDGNILPLEDVVENQRGQLEKFAAELEQLQKEKRQLEEELRIAQSDRKDIETAITNYFVNYWRTGK